MFFSQKLIEAAYSGLVKLDTTDGKSRKEKISGLRYLLATSHLLKKKNLSSVELAVGSDLRSEFSAAVGDVVAITPEGLYTKDFSGEFDTKKNDYGVGSNFLTTRLANSRSQDVKYPGRPAPLLLLKKERVSILDEMGEALVKSYNIGPIKAELCIWLLRNEDFDTTEKNPSCESLLGIISKRIKEKYTDNVVSVITPDIKELEKAVNGIDGDKFVDEKPDYSNIVEKHRVADAASPLLPARVLMNDLSDDDDVFITVQRLLERGAKGVLFSGPPGTSKTWYALKVALKIVGGDESKLERVQFHPSFTYEDFVEGLVSTGSALGVEPMFKPKDKVFLNLCEKARNDTDNLYILIIDEFSRGDPSKIFGELLTYIEPDYRDIEFSLPYSEKKISIPQNVVIFATMNPYDKSVVDLDSAMERRFDVVELLPSAQILRKLLQDSGVEGVMIGAIVAFFNIANRHSPHGIGHTYFKDVREEIDLILLWNHKLKFIFEKMFRFNMDIYREIKASYLEIIGEDKKSDIA